jgi:hypothetical protein
MNPSQLHLACLQIVRQWLTVFSLLFIISAQLVAQCGEPGCVPAVERNGPNPCMAKMYCSNSGNAQGLVTCTNSADTDGCGIDRTTCGQTERDQIAPP